MRKVRRIRRQGQDVELIGEQLAAIPASAAAIDTKVALIQELIPLGLLHVQESLQQEVERLIALGVPTSRDATPLVRTCRSMRPRSCWRPCPITCCC